MGKTQKDDVRIFREFGNIQLFADEPRMTRQKFVNLMDGFAHKTFRRHVGKRHLRMANQIAEQFSSGIACGANDGYSDHELSSFCAPNKMTPSPMGGLALSRSP